MKRLFILLLVFFAFVSVAFAQTRKSVSGAEVTGTFRSYYKGKFKGNFNEIKILALGKGKLKVSFGLTYPFVDGSGNLEANVDEDEGTADIVGDTAIYSSNESGTCKITIKFVKSGQIRITQEANAECGFDKDSANGIYRKVSNAKPKFE